MNRLLTAAAAGLLIGGCVPAAKDAGFADVARLAGERGVADLREPGSDQAVDRVVAPLLAKELSADDAVRVALLNNRRLRAAFESLGVARAAYVRAATWRNPVLSLDVKLPDGGDGGTKIEAGVAASLLDLLLLPARRRAARAVLAAERAGVAAGVIDLARDVRLAHLDVQAAGQTLELRQTAEQAFAASDELAKRLRRAGNITALRAATEAAAFEAARLDTADAQQQLSEARGRLAVLMGMTNNHWSVPKRLPELTSPATRPADDFDAQFTAARMNSLALAVSRSQALAAAERAGLADAAGFLDDVEIGAATERETDGAWLTGPTIAVPIPLFDWGQAERSGAAAAVRQAVARTQALSVELAGALRVARAAAAARQQAALRYRDVVVPLAGTVVDESQKEYNAMLIDAFSLLEARRRQVNVAARFITATHAAHAAAVRLDALVAGGSPGAGSPSMSIDQEDSYSQEKGH